MTVAALHQLAADTPDIPCRIDPETWFSDDPADRHYAAHACHNCPILTTCLQHAPTERWGVWGGIDTQKQRTRTTQHAA